MNLAAINGHPSVVEFFLSNPAAEVLKNSSGENILDIASKSEQREVAAVIAKHERSVVCDHIYNDRDSKHFLS